MGTGTGRGTGKDAGNGRFGLGGGGADSDHGSAVGPPLVSLTRRRAVRFALCRRSRTPVSTRWYIADASRNRTSAFVGCTLTSTKSGGISRNRNATA